MSITNPPQEKITRERAERKRSESLAIVKKPRLAKPDEVCSSQFLKMAGQLAVASYIISPWGCVVGSGRPRHAVEVAVREEGVRKQGFLSDYMGHRSLGYDLSGSPE